MKKLLISIALVLLLAGCQASDETKAKKVSSDYLKMLYDTSSYEGEYQYDFDTVNELGLEKLDQIDDYITDHFKEGLMSNLVTNSLYRIAFEAESRFEVTRIELTLNTDKDDYMTFYYLISISFLDIEKEYFDIKGQIKVVKEEDQWLVDSETRNVLSKAVKDIIISPN